MKHIDTFKCIQCGQHKSGLEVGSTCDFPLATPPRLEVTCKACIDKELKPATAINVSPDMVKRDGYSTD